MTPLFSGYPFQVVIIIIIIIIIVIIIMVSDRVPLKSSRPKVHRSEEVQQTPRLLIDKRTLDGVEIVDPIHLGRIPHDCCYRGRAA